MGAAALLPPEDSRCPGCGADLREPGSLWCYQETDSTFLGSLDLDGQLLHDVDERDYVARDNAACRACGKVVVDKSN